MSETPPLVEPEAQSIAESAVESEPQAENTSTVAARASRESPESPAGTQRPNNRTDRSAPEEMRTVGAEPEESADTSAASAVVVVVAA